MFQALEKEIKVDAKIHFGYIIRYVADRLGAVRVGGGRLVVCGLESSVPVK